MSLIETISISDILALLYRTLFAAVIVNALGVLRVFDYSVYARIGADRRAV